MKRIIRISFAVVVAILCISTANIDSYAESKKFTDDFYIISETKRELAPGITDRRIVLNTEEGDRQTILYVCEFDIRKDSVEIFAGYPDYDPSKLKTDTVTNQAKAMEAKTGKDVVVAVNNNFYEYNGEPLDIMIMNGKLIYGVQGQYFFGCTFDDEAAIGPYKYSMNNLKEAVGCRYYIVENGKAHKIKAGEFTSRNAVGVKPDGTAVYLVTQGKNPIVSNGIEIYELAEFMVALGCETAVFPDGGGSCTYAAQQPGSNDLVVENKPSYGVERNVSTTLMITSTEAGKQAGLLTTCQKEGHNYEKEGESISCALCEEKWDVDEFSGLVTDKSSGKKMYYINGRFQTGWTMVDQEAYYFNDKGLSEKITVKEYKQLECNSDGYTVYRCDKAFEKDGKEFKVPASYKAPGHNYDDNNICSRCGWKEVAFEECKVTTKSKVYTYTGKAIKPTVIIESEGKVLKQRYDYRIVGYENNVKYGTGKIYISTNFTNGAELLHNSSSIERREKPFVITFKIRPPKVADLKGMTVGTSSVKLSWERKNNIEGYEIYRVKNGKTHHIKTIKNPKTTSYIVKGLSAGYGYAFKVRTYVKNKKYFSEYSNTAYVQTKPGRVVIDKLKTGKSHYIKVSWKKKTGSGYQVMMATDSKFKKGKKTYKITSSNTLSKKVTNLKKSKRYYVKVRAYKMYNGKTQYGQWSKYKTIKCK